MKITIFDRHDVPGRAVDVGWESFATMAINAPEVADKFARPAFGPYTLNGGRCDANVKSYTALVFDFDHLTVPEFESILTKAGRFRSLIYTTWSTYIPGKAIAIRLIFPFEFAKSEWRKLRKMVTAWLGVPSDPDAEKLSQISYLPCYRPGDPKPYYWIGDGPPFDPWALPGSRKITGEDFEDLFKYLKSRSRTAPNPDKRDKINRVIRTVTRCIQGVPYASIEEGRHNALTSMFGYMQTLWGTDVDTDTILEVMRRSLDVMAPERGYAHAKATIEDLFAKARKEERDAREERIREHFERLGEVRSDPYTEDEVAYMKQEFAAGARNSLVVLCGKQLFALTLKGYRLIGDIDRPDLLRAFAPFDVDLTKTAPQLLAEYGQHAERLQYTYAGTTSFNGSTLTIRTAPLRKLAAKRHREVDLFLDALVGLEHSDTLRTWLSWLPHVEQPLVCLYLEGKSGAGKSLLMKGVSRLWGHFIPMHHAIGEFNAGLLKSPFCWADERFPRNERGYHKTEEFRDFIQCFEHTINDKHLKHVHLLGYPRTAITANNESILRAAVDNLTVEDAEAITRRILRLEVKPTWGVDLLPLIDSDMIAEYVLSLPKPKSVTQFAIEPKGTGMVDHLITSTFLGSTIAQMCLHKLICDPTVGYVVRDNAFHVLPSVMFEEWPTTIGKRPRADQLAEVLRSISEPGDKKHIVPSKGSTMPRDGKYYRIRTEILERMAEHAGHPDNMVKRRIVEFAAKQEVLEARFKEIKPS